MESKSRGVKGDSRKLVNWKVRLSIHSKEDAVLFCLEPWKCGTIILIFNLIKNKCINIAAEGEIILVLDLPPKAVSLYCEGTLAKSSDRWLALFIFILSISGRKCVSCIKCVSYLPWYYVRVFSHRGAYCPFLFQSCLLWRYLKVWGAFVKFL